MPVTVKPTTEADIVAQEEAAQRSMPSVVIPGQNAEEQLAFLDGEGIQSAIEDDRIRAKFKIEIHFGRDRSMSSLKPSTGMMLIWESGKKYHGGGDEQMFWCGYKDCNKPITSDNFGPFSLVCPTCKRECFLDVVTKKSVMVDAKKKGENVEKFRQMPVIYGEKIFKLSPPKLAALIDKVWRDLACNADLYLKYHPEDIRYDPVHQDGQAGQILGNARSKRGAPMIYPLKNILKDTAAGASTEKRFLACITA
jgi:hypothetical protein